MDRHARRRLAPASWTTSDSTLHAAPGVRIAIGEPGHGIAGFRQSHNEAIQARRVAELAGRPLRHGHPLRARRARRDGDRRPRPGPHIRATRAPRAWPPTTISPPGSTATLRTYLDEHSSRSRTAKRLGIHENTVSYRIKQAEEILGRSVDQRTLELRVALALANLVAIERLKRS